MVVRDHPSFRLPEDHDAPIWRYLDFPRFISMLEVGGGSLHFSRPDQFDDHFECLPSNVDQQKMDELWAIAAKSQPVNWSGDAVNSAAEYAREYHRSMPRLVAVNCWHRAEYESAAMWTIYGEDRAIAVRTTARRLIDCLNKNHEHSVRVGMVEYVDPSNPAKISNMFDLVLRKRKSFEHEQELRAVIGDLSPRSELPEEGVTVRLPIQELVESVFVAPEAQPWYRDLVERMCTKYKLGVAVITSSLAERSLW